MTSSFSSHSNLSFSILASCCSNCDLIISLDKIVTEYIGEVGLYDGEGGS